MGDPALRPQACAASDPLIGRVVGGRFEVLEEIGAGGMGTVYRAREKALGRLVALKVLRPLPSHQGARVADRFSIEAQATAKLRHPNTVTLFDYGVDGGVHYMALELLEGRTLQRVLDHERRISWPRALSIAGQVARALGEAHQLGLIHRDLKPSNIMVLPEGSHGERIKVLDFGLVKALTGHRGIDADLKLTGEHLMLCSTSYMAPEQARRRSDPRTDIYSLGAVLFAAMTGRPPFLATAPLDLVIKHLHEPPPELRSLADIPPLVNALVMRCLEKDPAARFQSMDELLVSMHHAVTGLGFGGLFVTEHRSLGFLAGGSEPSGPRTTELAGAGPEDRRRSWWSPWSRAPSGPTLALVGALALALGTGAALGALSRSTPAPGLRGEVVSGCGAGASAGEIASRGSTPADPLEAPASVAPAAVVPLPPPVDGKGVAVAPPAPGRSATAEHRASPPGYREDPY